MVNLQPEPDAAPGTTALPLLVAWAALVVYASLFPFEGWALPAGSTLSNLLWLPWPAWRDRFDEVANLVGYWPFGVLACATWIRRGHRLGASVMRSVLLAAALSYGVELAQNMVPSRVPSMKDVVFNVMGAALGAITLGTLAADRWLVRWQRTRERWFERHSAPAMALMLLWPVGLLFPTSVPLGLGYERLELLQRLAPWVEGTLAEGWIQGWMAGPAQDVHSLTPEHEAMIVALGLLAPCLLAFSMTVHAGRRMALALGALVLAWAVSTLSTALSFGPEHALAWITPNGVKGMAVGAIIAGLCVAMPARAAAWFGVMVLAGLMAMVWHAPTDPYYAASLSTWEQGRFIRFHGVAQWLGWLWPYATLAWLMHHATTMRDEG